MTEREGHGMEVKESAGLQYVIAGPSGAGRSPGMPILCFLHGYEEAAPTPIHRGLTRHGPLREGNPLIATDPFIVVAPQLPLGGDIWHRYADAVAAIVREVQRNAFGDPDRTYLTGFSFGANGVFDIAATQPGLWAALWTVDPTRVPEQDPGLPLWLSFGDVARRREDDFVRTLRLVPADADPEGNRLYLDRGEDHVGSAKGAYGEERVYHWLLARRLPSPITAY